MELNTLFAPLMKLLPILYAFIGFGLLIVIHELGHFLFCKLFNVHTPTFSIGMGPTIFQKKLWNTNFQVALLPLGGYVEIAGIQEVGQGTQEFASAHDKTAFRSKPYIQKLLILLGGILFNIIFAYMVMIFVAARGTPKTNLTINAVTKDSPAYEAGLESGDIITKINDAVVEDDFAEVLKELQKIPTVAAPEVNIEILRAGSTRQVHLNIPAAQPEELPKQGRLGLAFSAEPSLEKQAGLPLLSAISVGVHKTHEVIEKTFLGIKSLFTQRSLKGAGGPVLILSESTRLAQKGFIFLLIFLSFISINLAIINLLPLPILDGGQLLFVTIEALIGREIPHSVKMGIHIASWLLVLSLLLYLTYNDLIALIRG
jgi:regulator of sigma E protease